MTEGPKGSKRKRKSNDKAKGTRADSLNDVSDQVVVKIKPNSRKRPSNESKATGSVDDMDEISDQGEAKGKPKSHKHPTNSLNLPGAVKSESALWRITILGAYRAYMACMCEVWTVNDSTALRHLQIIWDFYANDNQAYKFVPNDPILPLVSIAIF